MRCINADELLSWFDNHYDDEIVTVGYVSGLIKDSPTVEPERKTGKWRRRLVDCGFNADWHCSRCGWKTSLEEHGYNFCPNCGAKMDGGEQE